MSSDSESRSVIERELQPGEKLLWAGKPTPMRVALRSVGSALGGAFMLVFSLFWLGFVSGIVGGFGGRTMPGGTSGFVSIFPLFGWLFLVIGLAITLRPVWEYLTAGRMVYGLTDSRAIIIKPGLTGMAVQSYTPDEMGEIERREVNGGIGDLTFARQVYYTRDRYRTRRHFRAIGFWGIQNVREVERLLLENVKRREEE